MNELLKEINYKRNIIFKKEKQNLTQEGSSTINA